MAFPCPTPAVHTGATRGRWVWGALALGWVWLAAPPSARALELYSLLDETCRGETGLIVAVKPDAVTLLSVEGVPATVPRDAVRRILVFNTLKNPIAELNLDGALGGLAREVTLDGEGEAPVVGWPIQFRENAIVVFDLDGKLHVEDIDRITGVRRAPPLPAHHATSQFEPQAFLPGPDVAECTGQDASGLPAVYPTRILSDQIKISGFLSVFENGFDELERFRVRSAFYARPQLYDDQTKLALVDSDFEYFKPQELPVQFPLYLQWGSGSVYRSQGFFVLGAKPVEWLPNVGAVFAIRSDVKASFFTASFVGNPQALAVGADFVVDNRFSYDEFFSELGNEIMVFPHLNHLALTGADWGSYSFSAGYYYPIVGIFANGAFREVLSPRPAPIVRIMHTGAEHRFRLLYSSWDAGSGNPDDDDIRIVLAEDMRNPSVISPDSDALAEALDSFSLDSRFARAGLDYEVNREVTVGVDQVYFAGTYRERVAGGRYTLDYEHHVTALHGYQRFGEYAALHGYLNYFDRRYRGVDGDDTESPRYRRFSLTVAIEFNL